MSDTFSQSSTTTIALTSSNSEVKSDRKYYSSQELYELSDVIYQNLKINDVSRCFSNKSSIDYNTYDICIGCNIHRSESKALLSLITTSQKGLFVNSSQHSINHHCPYVFPFENNNDIDISSFFTKEYRFTKNLDFVTPKLFQHKNNINLKTCLTNIFTNEKIVNGCGQICSNCIVMLIMTGVLVAFDAFPEPINSNFFCCFSCDKPTQKKNCYYIKKCNDDKKTSHFILTNNMVYFEYSFDSKKYFGEPFDVNVNYSFCDQCVEKLTIDKTIVYHENYYYDQLFDSTSIPCYSCMKVEAFNARTRFDLILNNPRSFITSNRAISSSNFSTCLVVKNTNNNDHEYGSSELGNLVVYDTRFQDIKMFQHDLHNYYCIISYSNKIKNNYLQYNAQYFDFLNDIFPSELQRMILDYYVLYYTHCNCCFNINNNENILKFQGEITHQSDEFSQNNPNDETIIFENVKF